MPWPMLLPTLLLILPLRSVIPATTSMTCRYRRRTNIATGCIQYWTEFCFKPSLMSCAAHWREQDIPTVPFQHVWHGPAGDTQQGVQLPQVSSTGLGTRTSRMQSRGFSSFRITRHTCAANQHSMRPFWILSTMEAGTNGRIIGRWRGSSFMHLDGNLLVTDSLDGCPIATANFCTTASDTWRTGMQWCSASRFSASKEDRVLQPGLFAALRPTLMKTRRFLRHRWSHCQPKGKRSISQSNSCTWLWLCILGCLIHQSISAFLLRYHHTFEYGSSGLKSGGKGSRQLAAGKPRSRTRSFRLLHLAMIASCVTHAKAAFAEVRVVDPPWSTGAPNAQSLPHVTGAKPGEYPQSCGSLGVARKRAYRRARQRAMHQGYTWYRGREHPHPAPISGILHCPTGRSQPEVLHVECSEGDPATIYVITETRWASDMEWHEPSRKGGLSFIHTGAGSKSAGILVSVPGCLFKSNAIQYDILAPGRLLRIRLAQEPSIEIICAYQHAWHFRQEELRQREHRTKLLARREEHWNTLRNAIRNTPFR